MSFVISSSTTSAALRAYIFIELMLNSAPARSISELLDDREGIS